MHFPPLSKTVPSGQTHATDRLGRESITTHLWSNWHGLLTVQGFWQVWDIHASLEGQSWSTRHSGSSATIAKEKIKIDQLLFCFYNNYHNSKESALRSVQET